MFILLMEVLPFSDYYQTQGDQQCLTDPPETEVDYSLVTMTMLTRGSLWNGLLVAYGLQDSIQTSGYLQLISHDQEPVTAMNMISQFNVTSTKVCTRLCVRVNGCGYTWSDEQGLRCNLYQTEPLNYLEKPGSKLYMLIV